MCKRLNSRVSVSRLSVSKFLADSRAYACNLFRSVFLSVPCFSRNRQVSTCSTELDPTKTTVASLRTINNCLLFSMRLHTFSPVCLFVSKITQKVLIRIFVMISMYRLYLTDTNICHRHCLNQCSDRIAASIISFPNNGM